MEPRTTFLQRYASEVGGDAAFGLRAQWRRTDFECADPPCGVDQPAKAGERWGDTGRKDGTAALFSRATPAARPWPGKRTQGVRGPDVHLPARGHALQRCMHAGGQD